MRSSTILAIALATCSAALAVPPRSALPPPTVGFGAESTPDCAAIKDYCKCLDADFNCETDPRCEWCREHNAWNNPPPPAPSSTPLPSPSP
ncbi:hypothetical protein F5Y05DRAFT_413418 [Hypoxylon sp. FL0543]|nr:hypothetical protein F5Y05DRAFT_413418 [Hypoxylon sp. FL0543]